MAKKMTQCPQGHMYDADQYPTCPHCPIPDVHPTTPVRREPRNPQQPPDPTRPHGEGRKVDSSNPTRPYYPPESGFDPVVGWLVCIEGKERGKDYRIKAEWNFIGRDLASNICIQGDDDISRHKHARLNFDPRSGAFWLAPGEARKNTYHNGELVMGAVQLKADDQIELGHTRLVFVPLCGETFSWEQDAGQMPEPTPPDEPQESNETKGAGTFVPPRK